MTYEEWSRLIPERKLTQQEAYALEHSGITPDQISHYRESAKNTPMWGREIFDRQINTLIAKGREILKLKGLPVEGLLGEKFNFEPDAQDELAAAGIDNRELSDKKNELLSRYGPSGEKRYYDFVTEQRKKGREALDKQKVGASNPAPPPAPSIPAPPASSTSASAPPQATLPAAPPQATSSSFNLSQAPHNNAIYKGQRERFIKDFGFEKGEEAYKNWVERSSSKPGTAQAPSQSNKRELFPDVGDQIDPETGRRIPAEVVSKLTAQEIARRLANKPYVENPYNRTAELTDLERGGYSVLHDLVERGRNPDGIGFFNPPRGGGGRALDDFYNQDFKYDKAITLKDKLMENVRANALKRLNKSYEELGHQMSARRMGRNGYEDVLKKEMRENMDAELNMIDSKMAYDLLAQQNQLAGQGVQHVQNQDAIEYKKAHDAYVLNKAEEESRKEEQKKNALLALSHGQGLRQLNQEDLNRRAAEFERKNTHHDRQADSYLARLKESQVGTPNLILNDRYQSFAPGFAHHVQPGDPARMSLAPGTGAPTLSQVEPNTALKDTVGALAAGAGLFLKNKAIDKLGKDIDG